MAIKSVVSRDNPLFKRLRALAGSSQARKKEGLSLLDGAHLVGAYVAARGAPALLAVGESALLRPEVVQLVNSAGVAATRMPDALIDSISGVMHGAGIVAAVPTPRESVPEVIKGDCLLLDHLQDPGNLGSLLRSAAAAGVQQVFCSTHTVYAWAPKVLRAGQGAHFSLRIFEGCDLEEVVDRLQAPLVATSSHAGQDLFATDLRGTIAWVFGNEGAGVSPTILARAARRIAIPIQAHSESLNVAAAAAVCLFEARRQRALARPS
ncbi:MAG: TrmH family RNA methyltransferase [Burkholderiales bacterium]